MRTGSLYPRSACCVQGRDVAAAEPRSARQRCERGGGAHNYLAKRPAAVVRLDHLRDLLQEREEEEQRQADAEAARQQKRRRIARWGEAAGEEEDQADAGLQLPVLAMNCPTERAIHTARAELVANSDLQHLELALRWYYYPGERAPGPGPLPEKIDIVRSGCIAAQLAHHPEDLDRRAGPTPALKRNLTHRPCIGPRTGRRQSG
jgi:hypothetical protein